jgi:enoyl-CoA hydratase
MVLDGRPEEADAYFAAEYFMNGLIASYPKPTVALTHGVVMGGGIGIAGHCRYRVSLGEGKWAMPEAAIGFVSDVGVNAILAKLPIDTALDFLMAGAPVDAAGAVALRLLDAMVAVDGREDLLSDVAAAAKAKDVDAAMLQAIRRRTLYGGVGVSAETPSVPLHAIGIDWTDFEAAATTVAALHQEQVKRNSPTSLFAIHQSHLAARRVATVGAVLAIDLALAQLMCRWPDFAEGVRAVLVDKDQRPDWQPADIARVETGGIRAAIAAAIGPKLVRT